MQLGIQAMNSGKLRQTLKAFNKVVEIEPNFAEGWNKRATIYYLLQKYTASVKDIAQTLLGRHQAVLKAFEQAKFIHPHISGVQQHIKLLKEFLKGEKT